MKLYYVCTNAHCTHRWTEWWCIFWESHKYGSFLFMNFLCSFYLQLCTWWKHAVNWFTVFHCNLPFHDSVMNGYQAWLGMQSVPESAILGQVQCYQYFNVCIFSNHSIVHLTLCSVWVKFFHPVNAREYSECCIEDVNGKVAMGFVKSYCDIQTITPWCGECLIYGE